MQKTNAPATSDLAKFSNHTKTLLCAVNEVTNSRQKLTGWVLSVYRHRNAHIRVIATDNKLLTSRN